jgi:hypothetical protein
MTFEVLIDDTFLHGVPTSTLSPASNKRILSLINDFEEKKWRLKKFRSFIWDNIAETALSQKERLSLVNQSHSMLVAAAENLRLTDLDDDVGKGSELAEVVLYGIMKEYYSALPVVPKIFYKQNSQDNAKGADSVHIVIDGDDFSLWFGEAKFYKSLEDARLSKIVESVASSLSPGKLKKENSIITNVSDIDLLPIKDSIRSSIKSALSPKESLDKIKSKINIPILILHECGLTGACKEITDEYKAALISFHKGRATSYFKKQIDKIGGIFKYSEIKFHIILFPVPSKKEIVDNFVGNVQYFKEQGK